MCLEKQLSDVAGVQAGYDRWAAVYDIDDNPMQALEGQAVRAALSQVDGLAVLDLGCGTGRHALRLAESGASVTALDFSEGMLGAARQKPGAGAVDFLMHDLQEPLPFEDSTFDVVVSGLVLEHLQDLTAFFSEIHRVLKPGGRSVVSAMHPAMFLRSSHARFVDPSSGELVYPGSIDHKMSDMLMAAVHANLALSNISEHSPDAAFVERFKMKQSSADWPMVVVLQLSRDA